jgi:hypothetical protein
VKKLEKQLAKDKDEFEKTKELLEKIDAERKEMEDTAGEVCRWSICVASPGPYASRAPCPPPQTPTPTPTITRKATSTSP